MDSPAPSRHAPLLRIRGVGKNFSGVRALRGVSLDLRRGEVLALVGENGAGKSTLLKVLSGALAPDSGEVLIDGSPRREWSPLSAQAAGVSIIYQELNLIGDLSVSENIYLGRERTRFGFVNHAAQARQAAVLLSRLGAEIDPTARCRQLSLAQQQYVEIVKALSWNARIVVMDEPTAALNSHDAERLLQIVEDLKQQGLGVIYVSHRLEEIFRVADRILVLRDGAVVGEHQAGCVTRKRLIEEMVGRPIESEFPARHAKIGAEVLAVQGLQSPAIKGVSFTLRAGEVLGVGGLAGSGRTELARLIFGADRALAGRVYLHGRPVRITSPRQAIRQGVCLLTEDRKAQGLVLAHSVQHNFGLPNLERFRRGVLLNKRLERERFLQYVDRLNIKLAGPMQRAAYLSGGNQQKVVLAKWLAREAQVIIFDEPTRGIDVGAKFEIYQLINELAAQGKAILMISSDLPELLGMSDRILVMRQGGIAGEISDVAGADQQQVLELSMPPSGGV